MTQNHNSLKIEQIDETFIVPVTTTEAMGATAFTQVTLDGNLEQGGQLRNAETGEPLLDLKGTEDLDDEREAA